MMPSPRPRSTRQARAGLTYALGDVSRANPLVVAYRWRYELSALAGLAAAWMWLGPIGFAAVTGAVAMTIGALACWHPGRQFLRDRMWCIVTPHRVRVGCGQAWIHSRNGKIPAVLLTRRTTVGERVYLWCRAGTSAYDLSSAHDLLAAACWAQDVVVTRYARHSQLVTLDVIRHGIPTPAELPDAPVDAEAPWGLVPKGTEVTPAA